MNDCYLQDSIQTLVLGFFQKISASVIQKDCIFTISVPESYYHLFGEEPFSITFDSKTVSGSNSELVAPGSLLLQKIINLCKMKGPICKGYTKNLESVNSDMRAKYGIRFYFNISHNGMNPFSNVLFVDLDVETSSKIEIDDEIILNSELSLEKINSEILSSLYLQSVNEIRKLFDMKEKEIEKNTSLRKKNEAKKIQEKYDQLILDIEHKIKESERILTYSKEKHAYFDDSMNQISDLRDTQKILISNLENEFSSLLSYEIIAVIFFRYLPKNF